MSDRLVIGEARWAAMREMREAYGVPLRLMADVVGVATSTVGSHARRQKWSAPAGRGAGHADRRGPRGLMRTLRPRAPTSRWTRTPRRRLPTSRWTRTLRRRVQTLRGPGRGADAAPLGADAALGADGASNGADAALGQHAASPGANDALDAGADGLADGSAEALSAFARGQLRALLRDAKSGRIDKAQVDAVWSVFRMVEKAETLAEGARQIQQKRSDDELAAIFDRINARIVELAGELAERRGVQQPDGLAG